GAARSFIGGARMGGEGVGRARGPRGTPGGGWGTNLVGQLAMGLDGVAEVLGRQHGMPAALQRHFDMSDPAVQARVPAEVAARLRAVPLGRLPAERGERIAVAVMDPLPAEAIAELAGALGGAEVVPAVALELRVLDRLVRDYGSERPNRFN